MVTTPEKHEKRLACMRTVSLLLGFLLGVFVQLSTLGANFVELMTLGSTSNTRIDQLSFVWSTGSSCLAVASLVLIRRLITGVFEHALSRMIPNDDSNDNIALKQLLAFVENRFVVGALAGFVLAWAVTDYFMGIDLEIMHGICSLFVIFLWSRKPRLSPYGSKENQEEDEDIYVTLM